MAKKISNSSMIDLSKDTYAEIDMKLHDLWEQYRAPWTAPLPIFKLRQHFRIVVLVASVESDWRAHIFAAGSVIIYALGAWSLI